MPKRFSTASAREFGDGVRAALAGTGLTAREICEKIGWDPGKLSDLLNGKAAVRRSTWRCCSASAASLLKSAITC
jgi:transcriptional regulator with XRE-family HTH domain